MDPEAEARDGVEKSALLSASSNHNSGHAEVPQTTFSLPSDGDLGPSALPSEGNLGPSEEFQSAVSASRSSFHNAFSRDDFGRLMHDRGPEEAWMTQPLRLFTEMYRGKRPSDRKLSAGARPEIRKFYKRQDSLIREFQDVEDLMFKKDRSREESEHRKAMKVSGRMAAIVMTCNLILLVGKAVAVYLSGSLSVISSLVDSSVDVASGLIIWWTNRMVMRRNPYKFPQGRTRLEPVAIIILSVIMGSASLQVIKESIQNIVQMALGKAKAPHIEIPTVVIIATTVVLKIVLFIACWFYLRGKKQKYMHSMAALAQDQRNDFVANSVVFVSAIITHYYKPAKYCDPVGAIIIGLYIIVGWWKTGSENIKSLTGHTADPHLLQKLTFICINHHKDILSIDTVRAFHHGCNIFAEVDIVLPSEMKLREAHDIGESLQVKLERLDEVERAFVHLDYECSHDPRTEHKQV